MKKLHPSTQYKKDLKRIRNNPKKAEALLEVLRLLEFQSDGGGCLAFFLAYDIGVNLSSSYATMG